MKKELFRNWILQKMSMKKKVACDIISRYNRASNYLGYEPMSIEDIEKLNECEDFLKCSTTVKSQMRRSIKLYIQYKGEMENDD